MYYIGIDLSLTGTGIVVLDKSNNNIFQKLISTNSKIPIEERLIYIEKELIKILNLYKPCLVNIEGLSFNSNGKATLDSAGLHFLIRIFLYKNEIPFIVTPPTSLKKFVTGKGNCKKNLMLKEVYKKWNVDVQDDNICDAYCLARMKNYLDSLNEEKIPISKSQKKRLDIQRGK